MKLKKIIAVTLAAMLSVIPTERSIPEITASAKENSGGEVSVEEKAVTDMSEYETDEFLVVYQDGAGRKEKKEAVAGLDAQKTEVTDWCDKVKLEPGENLEAAVEAVAENENVAYVQPNYRYSIMSSSSSAEDIVNVKESEFSKQWWAYNDGTFEAPEDETEYRFPFFDRNFWWFDDIMGNPFQNMLSTKTTAAAGIDTNTVKAWNQFQGGGRTVKIAVIDTGIDYGHSQLKDSIWTNSGEIPDNGRDDDGNGYIDDVYGWDFYYDSNDVYVGTSKGRFNAEDEDEHGTHVAGVIAAEFDKTGIAGIASNTDVELMCLKVLGGTDGAGETDDIVKAIEYAQEQGAVICNMSFGINESDIPFYYQDYDKAMKEAIQKSSMLFVTAAGNDGTDNDREGVYPSSYDFDNIISVANLNCDGTLSLYSNYGKETVDIAAPGMYIYSTTPNETYAYMSGTSMATPMVTAACAMGYAYAENPDILAVRERILANVTKLSGLSGKLATGGMLNVYDAVADLAGKEYSYENTNQQDSGTEDTEKESNGTEDTDKENSGTEDTDKENSGTENTDKQDTAADNSGNEIKEENPEENNNVPEQEQDSVIGKQFISGGVIYRILSETEAAATGNADSSAKKVTIASSVPYGNAVYKVTKITEKAFYKNQSMKTLSIGKNVAVIGKSAFIGCRDLKKVTGMKSVRKIKANAFKNCKKLKSVRLTEAATEIAASSFKGCGNLKIKTVKGSYAAVYAKKQGIKVSY